MQRKNVVYIGPEYAPIYTFSNEDESLIEAEGTMAVDVSGDNLQIDTLALTVNYSPPAAQIYAPLGYRGYVTKEGKIYCTNKVFDSLNSLPYGSLVSFYTNDSLFGKFYVKDVSRPGKTRYRINAVSAIGIFDRQFHSGGIYTGETFREVAADIIGGIVSFSIADAELATTRIYGWLPWATRRENLHQLLFCCGASITKDTSGDIIFNFLRATEATTIPEGRVYDGGNIDYTVHTSAVQITEHTFSAVESTDEIVLYNNTEGSVIANNTLVTFENAPIHSLTASDGLTVVKSGVNYAIVSGAGILMGKPYAHTTRLIEISLDSNGEENVVRVEKGTLISLANSENVARRVADYYSTSRMVSISFSMETEKIGQQLSFSDIYQEPTTGFFSSADFIMSEKIKADCKIVADYVPKYFGNNYDSAEVLIGEGEFDVSDSGATVAIIGGGQGGLHGSSGTSGGTISLQSYGKGGDGGAAGSGGEAGKVLTVKLLQGHYSYRCGIGGEDGAYGTDTEIYKDGALIYSSANGTVPPNGYINLFDGSIFAMAGTPGIKGGSGGGSNGRAESVTDGETTWTGGAKADNIYYDTVTYYGGYGGGAAVGANGNDGGQTTGGNGANAADRIAATVYGNGGDGGHGGGGGGAGGGDRTPGSSTIFPGRSGSGGTGGKGGTGGAGCVIKYTKEENI